MTERFYLKKGTIRDTLRGSEPLILREICAILNKQDNKIKFLELKIDRLHEIEDNKNKFFMEKSQQ